MSGHSELLTGNLLLESVLTLPLPSTQKMEPLMEDLVARSYLHLSPPPSNLVTIQVFWATSDHGHLYPVIQNGTSREELWEDIINPISGFQMDLKNWDLIFLDALLQQDPEWHLITDTYENGDHLLIGLVNAKEYLKGEKFKLLHSPMCQICGYPHSHNSITECCNWDATVWIWQFVILHL